MTDHQSGSRLNGSHSWHQPSINDILIGMEGRMERRFDRIEDKLDLVQDRVAKVEVTSPKSELLPTSQSFLSTLKEAQMYIYGIGIVVMALSGKIEWGQAFSHIGSALR